MSSRDRSLIALVVLIIVAVGGYFVIVQPAHHKESRLSAQITTAQASLSQAEAQVQAGLVAQAQYKIYAKQLRSISAAVPSDDQIPQLINELQAASDKNKVGFQAVSASSAATAGAAAVATPGTTATSFPSESFGLTLTGTYFSVANLLGTLASFVHADDKHFEASGRLISISGVSLVPGASNTATGTNSTIAGAVTASVTVLDYDVPTALLSSSPAATASSTTP